MSYCRIVLMSVEVNVLSGYYPVERMSGWVNVYWASVRGLLLGQVGSDYFRSGKRPSGYCLLGMRPLGILHRAIIRPGYCPDTIFNNHISFSSLLLPELIQNHTPFHLLKIFTFTILTVDAYFSEYWISRSRGCQEIKYFNWLTCLNTNTKTNIIRGVNQIINDSDHKHFTLCLLLVIYWF